MKKNNDKQLFWWSASVALDNNNAVSTAFRHISHLILYHIPQLARLDVFL